MRSVHEQLKVFDAKSKLLSQEIQTKNLLYKQYNQDEYNWLAKQHNVTRKIQLFERVCSDLEETIEQRSEIITTCHKKLDIAFFEKLSTSNKQNNNSFFSPVKLLQIRKAIIKNSYPDLKNATDQCNITSFDQNDNSPLLLAVSMRRTLMAAYLLYKRATVTEEIRDVADLLKKDKNMKRLIKLLNEDWSLSANNTNCELHHAVQQGSMKNIFSAMECGQSVNSRDKEGNMPLYHAILNENTDVIELLLQNGATLEEISQEDNCSASEAAELTGDDVKDAILSLINKYQSIKLTNI